jgi:cyclohexa-1,5-dienecarbonyl-CoA hydratase
MSDSPVRIEELESGAIWRVLLARPKANVIDSAMSAALTEVFGRARAARDLKAVCLEGEGPHFSFGASVEEHLPESVAAMLQGFHGLFRAIAASDVFVMSAVRGQCLGGGLELAAFAHRLIASPDANLGQPEIRLGVFAPVASVLLAERCGRGAADDLCLSGRSVGAEQAHACGLVDEVADDPFAAALAYAQEHLLPHSASSLRHAAHAVRRGFHARFFEELDAVERYYLEELMSTHDAVEGIRSFLGKRKAEWRNQ